MGIEGVRLCLEAGANDLGGTLMEESISRAAGASHGQEMLPTGMEAIITALLYVAWHAFGQAGVSAVTDPVNECSEACIDIIISDALASGAVDADVLTAVRRALVQAASTSPAIARYYAPHLLGPPINRTVLRALLAEGGTWTTGSSTHLPVDGPPSPAAMR